MIRSSSRWPARNERCFLPLTFEALISLKSVIVPLRRFFELVRENGHFVPLLRLLQRSSTFVPLSARRTPRRSRKILRPLTPQVTRTFDVIRFFAGGAAGVIAMGRVALVALPTPSVAVTVMLNAPALPNA